MLCLDPELMLRNILIAVNQIGIGKEIDDQY